MSNIFASKIVASKIVSGIFGAAAVSAAFGAVPFASGGDLAATGQDDSQTSASAINRGAKADRAQGVRIAAGPSQTVSVRLDGLSATSILIRLPAAVREEARNRSPVPGLAHAKSTVACEPVGSVLTEVAKQLQPGRCIT
jgi:hypothetical protein